MNDAAGFVEEMRIAVDIFASHLRVVQSQGVEGAVEIWWRVQRSLIETRAEAMSLVGGFAAAGPGPANDE